MPHPPGGKPLLLFFFSPRCGRSRRAEGHLAHLLQRHGNHHAFDVRRIDATRSHRLVEHFAVAELPVLIVLHEGRVAARVDTPRNVCAMREALGAWLEGDPQRHRHAFAS